MKTVTSSISANSLRSLGGDNNSQAYNTLWAKREVNGPWHVYAMKAFCVVTTS